MSLTSKTLLPTRSCIFLILGLSLFSLIGCSMYQNLTGYFNTYYNAKRTFDEAVTEVGRVPLKDRDTNYFAMPRVTGTAESKFDKVIEKCSRLIQFYPKSSLVDDGLLLIGKSYVYLSEHESALRKFGELQANYPDSDLLLESRFWAAKAHYYMQQHDEALVVLKELFSDARAEGESGVLLEVLLLQAQIFTERGDFDQAIGVYELAVVVNGDKAARAFAQYQLGLTYEKIGEREKALDTFTRVRDFSPDFQMQFRSRLKRGVLLYQVGEYDQALKVLDELNDEHLRPEEHGLVDLEIANTYQAMGDTTEAFALYNMIDTTYRRTEASARSMFKRASIYENDYRAFQKAREYYNKARSEFQLADITPVAQRRVESLDRYFTARTNLERYSAVLVSMTTPDSLKDTTVLADSSHPAVERISEEENQLVDAPPPSPDGETEEEDVIPRVQDVARRRIKPSSGDGFPNPSGSLWRRFADRDLVIDEDEEEEEPASESDVVRALVDRQEQRDIVPSGSGRGSTKSAAGQSSVPLSEDSVRVLLLRAYFELAGLYFLELNQPDSAVILYEYILDQHPASPLVPRVLYALTQLQVSRGEDQVADSLQSVLLARFGETEYAIQIQKQRGLDTVQALRHPSELKYEEAALLLESGMTEAALKQFKKIAREYPESEIAPKACYAVGWIYETTLVENDSATTWYAQLTAAYPSSVYAQQVQPKLTVRENPERLKDVIKITEIQPIAVPKAPERRKRTAADRIRQQQQQAADRQLDRNLDNLDDELDHEEPDEPDDDDE